MQISWPTGRGGWFPLSDLLFSAEVIDILRQCLNSSYPFFRSLRLKQFRLPPAQVYYTLSTYGHMKTDRTGSGRQNTDREILSFCVIRTHSDCKETWNWASGPEMAICCHILYNAAPRGSHSRFNVFLLSLRSSCRLFWDHLSCSEAEVLCGLHGANLSKVWQSARGIVSGARTGIHLMFFFKHLS